METYTDAKIQSWLSWFLRGVLILGFVVLLSRLSELQLIKGRYYQTLAEDNRINRVPINAPRGRILARGGEELASNIFTTKTIEFDPVNGYIKNEIGVNENSDSIKEADRHYNSGASAGHLTGYLGEVDEDEVGRIDPECLEKGVRRLGSQTGRGGIEEYYECTLRGVDGEQLIEVDTAGSKLRVLGNIKPTKGNDIKTHIDYKLQEKVATLLDDKKGAVIITDPKGEVLSLFSSPSFDPNVFLRSDATELNTIFDNKDLPLFNRVIGGLFHPGSVFKPLVAIAGLEEKAIEPDFLYNDTGEIVLKTLYGTFSYTNWYFTQNNGTEGEIDIVKAIARSTDTFFYKLGEYLGIDNINKWADIFNLTKETGIDLPGEIKGLVPNPDWKKDVKGERWFLGNTYHVAIGQGDLAISPLHVNLITTTIANNGTLCLPKIAGESDCKSLGIDDDNLDLVREGMVNACLSGGTGFTFFDFQLNSKRQVACKTGTAEVGIDGKSHAWFTAFGPVDSPEIVVTVLVEEGGGGSDIAGPIAREIFDYWFLVDELK